ncbi:Glycerol-3-phosphate dehydrogenase [Diplonema papillatum]|nr:Glycerol-3-phosphate dehydrogenase [Diplonema papillatum]
MDEALNTAWDPILRKYKDGPEPEYEPFRDRFQDHIGPHLMEAGTITGEELRILLRKKPKKSASGVDGWRMAELRELPLPLLNALADVMNLVEATGDWPASMTTALVSMVPKDESQDPLHTRPITVTSAVYRLWACRRLADIVLWQEGWIEEGQKGFRPGHRIEDVLMEIGLEVEDALLDGEPLYGVALDFRKCFDMVPREVVLRLAEDLGLHGRVLKPLRAIYSLLARRFKLPLGVGREFSVTNGILQGCPVSVILINALLSVVMKAVKKEAEGVSPKSYADDATLLSRLSEAALQKGVDIVDEFCTLTGMQLNLEKTIAFSTRQRHQSTLRLRSGNALLRFSKSVTCLGALVSTAKNRKERSDSKRVERAAALAEGLRHAPFRYEKRVRIVQSNVLPAALSGCSFAPVSKVAMKRLTTSVMGLIWGGANPKRAREMVLNFQEKGHLTDPGTCLAYRVTTAFYAACERLPRLLPLMESIRGRFLCVLSGPSFAKEVAAHNPTNVTLAALDEKTAARAQEVLSDRNFRAYTATDVIGAELCGALKNVIAIAAGASDGFNFGSNGRAALMSRGLAEMTRLIVKKGGKASTVMGLAGVGDLVLTCSSTMSRNYTVGYRVAKGDTMDQIRKDTRAVAEGVKTSAAIEQMAQALGVDMPICHEVYNVIHKDLPIKQALANLQNRPLRSELEGFEYHVRTPIVSKL